MVDTLSRAERVQLVQLLRGVLAPFRPAVRASLAEGLPIVVRNRNESLTVRRPISAEPGTFVVEFHRAGRLLKRQFPGRKPPPESKGRVEPRDNPLTKKVRAELEAALVDRG